jgi:hypothetical protein
MAALLAHLMLQERIFSMLASRPTFPALGYVTIAQAPHDEATIRLLLFIVIVLEFPAEPFMFAGLKIAQFIVRLPNRLGLLKGHGTAKRMNHYIG